MSEIEKEGSKAVFRPGRDIVASVISGMRQQLKELMADGITELTIDMSGVEMIDSVGLGLLISAHNSLSRVGGTLTVNNVSKDLYDLFSNMRLTQHFTVLKA